MLLTDNNILISAAKRNYNNFLVPTSLVESKKTKRSYTYNQKSDLDFKTSENMIGEIVNLSQELNTLIWDMLNSGVSIDAVSPIYNDVAKLDVMSGIEINKNSLRIQKCVRKKRIELLRNLKAVFTIIYSL